MNAIALPKVSQIGVLYSCGGQEKGMKKHLHAVFNELQFYEAFQHDLKSARALVLIQSPFLAPRRVEFLAPHIQACTKRNVRVCIFAQTPGDWDSPHRELSSQVKNFQAAMEMLRACGAHVTLRARVHEKLAVIDDSIFWEGSLNIGSHFNTSERMTKWISPDKVKEAILGHKLNFCDHCSSRPAFRIFVENTLIESINSSRLGRYIAAQRKAFGITQRNLAKQAGIDPKALAEVELGKRNIKLNGLAQILGRVESELVAVPWYLLPAVEEFVRRRSTDCTDRSDRA